MAATPIIARLRHLQAKAAANRLGAGEQDEYDEGRRTVLQVAAASQAYAFDGHPDRKHMRLTLALETTLVFQDGLRHSSHTYDIGTHGFSIVVPGEMAVGARAEFSIRLPGALAPIEGETSVVGLHDVDGLRRIGMKFERLNPAQRVRLELTLFDALLQRLP